MSLRILVLVKQVPDTKNVGNDAMKEDGTINRAALPTIFNPEDLHALEEALKIKETLGAVVTAITLGPPKAEQVLKECLFRGADDVILITDSKFAASDTLATSYALTCAINKIGKYDLIFCGRQAIDGDTAQVGPQIAQNLNINQLTAASEIVKADEKSITVRRFIEDGSETVRSKLPVLVTVTSNANEPRTRNARRVMMYKNLNCKSTEESYDEAYIQVEEGQLCSHIKKWQVTDIGADVNLCGLSGSPTKVKSIENVVLAARETKQITNDAQNIKTLMQELITEHII